MASISSNSCERQRLMLISELAARWQARGRPDASLLRGDELSVAKGWQVRRKEGALEIIEAQRTFIAASEEAATEQLAKERARLAEIAAAQERIKEEQARSAAAL